MLYWLHTALLLLFEGCAARRDARVRFLMAQIEILRRKHAGNRVVPSHDERARLLAIGRELSHDITGIIGIVTPRTYFRWVRQSRQGRSPKPVGRPKVRRDIRAIALRLARANAGWGYRRIVGELRKLRLRIGRSSVQRILKEEGLVPSPHRRGRAEDTAWRKFIRLHMNTLVASDFFTKQILTPFGKRTAFCLAFIHLGTRKVFVSPMTLHPHDQWVQQQARNMMMWLDSEQLEARFLIHDRDTKFSSAFRSLLANSDIQSIRTPRLAPDANAFAESWIGTLKRECLDHFLCFGRRHLDHIVAEYVRFYNRHRPHQSLDNRTLPAATAAAGTDLSRRPR